MSNITPIRSGESLKAPQPKRPRVRHSQPRDRFPLIEPPEGPSGMRLIQALHGVCQAIEETAESQNVDSLELGTAAEILATLLQDRITDING